VLFYEFRFQSFLFLSLCFLFKQIENIHKIWKETENQPKKREKSRVCLILHTSKQAYLFFILLYITNKMIFDYLIVFSSFVWLGRFVLSRNSPRKLILILKDRFNDQKFYYHTFIQNRVNLKIFT
jgi:hypothetical protein